MSVKLKIVITVKSPDKSVHLYTKEVGLAVDNGELESKGHLDSQHLVNISGTLTKSREKKPCGE